MFKKFLKMLSSRDAGSPHLLAHTPFGGQQCCSAAAAGLNPPTKGFFMQPLELGAVGVLPPACLPQHSCVQSCNVVFHT